MVVNTQSIHRHFWTLKDPRRNHLKRHPLINIITIAICGVIAGADDWQQIAVFARQRFSWLQKFLDMNSGVPSHDTLERVFDRINPSAFQRCFSSWVAALADGVKIKHIAIDGKTMRSSGNYKLKCLHLVSAWASGVNLSLGQIAVDDKSNEITAIPELLELLALRGALVTIDAMGCQRAIAETIVDKGGDYVFTVKDNQPTLKNEIEGALEIAEAVGVSTCEADVLTTFDKGHGREETRTYTILRDLTLVPEAKEWKGAKVIGKCETVRVVVKGAERTTSRETRYFIGSQAGTAASYARALRGHWAIVNNLHWQLDVSFSEDSNRVVRRHGAENLALIRKLALMLLKRHTSKESIACKRLHAALDVAFLEEVLASDVKAVKV